MIEHVFNYADSTIKEMTDFFETKVKNLEPKEDKKKSSAAAKKTKKSHKKRKKEYFDSSVVETSEEARKVLKFAVRARNTVFYMENAVILMTFAKIYVL